MKESERSLVMRFDPIERPIRSAKNIQRFTYTPLKFNIAPEKLPSQSSNHHVSGASC